MSAVLPAWVVTRLASSLARHVTHLECSPYLIFLSCLTLARIIANRADQRFIQRLGHLLYVKQSKTYQIWKWLIKIYHPQKKSRFIDENWKKSHKIRGKVPSIQNSYQYTPKITKMWICKETSNSCFYGFKNIRNVTFNIIMTVFVI